jgi:hypothetical protein
MRPVAFLLPALAAANPIALAQVGGDGWADGPDPNDIQIVSASFSGNGCPQGSVSTTISPDKTVSSLSLSLSCVFSFLPSVCRNP